jgi:hypothetical protein
MILPSRRRHPSPKTNAQELNSSATSIYVGKFKNLDWQEFGSNGIVYKVVAVQTTAVGQQFSLSTQLKLPQDVMVR